MKNRYQIAIPAALGVLAAASCIASLGMGRVESRKNKPYQLNADNKLARPTGYRSWIYVGTPVTPNDMNNGKAAFPEHHNVYINPESYTHYLNTGTWREGTILIKELVSVGAKNSVSGNGYFQGEFIGLEATIKSKKDFPDEPGNWAYFSFTNHDGGDLKDAAEPFPAASCNSCHASSAKDDFVFTQHYPILRAAKGAGGPPEDKAQRPKTLSAAPDAGRPAPSAPVESITYAEEGRDQQWLATKPTPASIAGTEVPTEQDALLEYLQSKAYKLWETRETKNHPTAGPHAEYGRPVRVFMNDTLGDSLRAGKGPHPVGSTAVKEMYKGRALMGWAVSIKTEPESDKGDGWFWYEVTKTTDGTVPVAIGNGVSGCAGCHSAGRADFVLSNWPLN